MQNGMDNLEDGINNGIDDMQNQNGNQNNTGRETSRLEDAGNNLVDSIREARDAIVEGVKQLTSAS